MCENCDGDKTILQEGFLPGGEDLKQNYDVNINFTGRPEMGPPSGMDFGVFNLLVSKFITAVNYLLEEQGLGYGFELFVRPQSMKPILTVVGLDEADPDAEQG